MYFRPAVASDPFVHFAPDIGLLYWTVAALSYVFAAVGLYLLFELYFSSPFRARKVAVLTALVALPVVPKLAAVVWPQSLALVFYEPLGAAAFAVGVVAFAREPFLSVRTPARRQLADSLSDFVVVLDGDGRIVDCNDSAHRAFEGLESSVGEPLAAVAPALAAHIDSGEELFELSVGGNTSYHVVRTVPISIGRRTVGTGVVLSDVTELETQRRRLEQQARHRDELTEGIAHELRNPLTIVRGQLEMLRADTSPDGGDGGDERVETAIGATERMERIIDDLISIISYGKPVTETEPLALTDLLERARETNGDGDIALAVACSDRTRVVAERARCTELFRLLVRAHQQRSATTISVERTDDGLAIESDGDQFGTDDPDLLFEYGVETSDEVRMLLANARTLAQVHGWSIRADTDAPGPRFVLEGVRFAPGP